MSANGNFYAFLQALSENNDRDWFEKNKAWYEKSKDEAEQIISNCIAEIGKIEDLGDVKVKDCMFRIYRDVRFSKNKDPYKLSFSALIGKNGRKDMGGFAYYLHFQAGESFMASGLYEPSPEQLAKIRQEIDYNPEALKSVIFNPDFEKMFGKMLGKQLKTTPKGFPKDHPEIDLLRYSQFYFSTPFQESEILSADFPRKLVTKCLAIRPFLEFLKRAID